MLLRIFASGHECITSMFADLNNFIKSVQRNREIYRLFFVVKKNILIHRLRLAYMHFLPTEEYIRLIIHLH